MRCMTLYIVEQRQTYELPVLIEGRKANLKSAEIVPKSMRAENVCIDTGSVATTLVGAVGAYGEML